ncbi:unnamed protein product [Cyprideis torosa]|uniref:Uncharacterized protein n=1 Tax=Cyprideis torosa TaxID=163714 RepID=A0A7R8W277_9CRUS|nr:unnamed protein product [Cyprideis torosa]CAG0881545.1 unnamed protein product [Cyprideis torosa]
MQRSKSPRRLSSPGRMRKPGSPRRSSSPGRMQRSRSPRRLSSPGRMQKPGSPRRLPSPGRMQRGRSPRRLPSPGRMQRSRSPRRLPSPSGRVKRLGSPSRLPSPGRMQRYGSPRGLRSPGRMQRSRSPRRPSSPGRMQRGGSPIRLPSPGRMQRSGSPRRGRSPAVGRRSRSPRRPPSPVLVKRPGSSVVRLGRESESPKRVRRTSVKSRSPPIHRRQMSQGQSAERSGSPRGRGGIERWSFSPSSRLEHELPASMNDGAEVYRPEVVNAEETRPVSISPGRFSDLEGHRERARMSSAPRGRGQWNYTRGRSSFRGRRSSDSRSDRRSPLPMDSPREGSPVLADTRFQGGSSPLQSGSPMVRLNQFEPPMMRSRSRSPLNRRLGGRVRRFSPPPRRQEEGQFDPGFAPLGDAEKDAQFSPEFRSGSLSPVLVGGGPIRVTVRGDNDEREIAFERPEDTMDHEERARLLEQELAAIEHRLEQNQPDRDELEHRQLIEEREERFRILDQELAHLEEIGAVPMADDEEGRGYSPPRFSPPLSRSSFPYRGESPHYRGMSQRPMRQFEGGRGHVRGGRAWGRGRFFHPRARGGPFPHYAMEGNRFHPGERQPLAERLDFLPEEPRAWFAREGSDGPGSRERFRTGDHRPHSRERWNPRPPDRSTERPKGPPLNQSDNLREDEIPPLNPPTDGKPLRSDVEKKPSKSDDHEKPPPVVNVSKKPWQSDDGKKPSKSENDKKSGEQKSQLSTEQKNLPAAMDVKKPIPKAEGKQPLLKKSDEKTEVSAKSCSVLEEPVDGEETFYCRHCNMDFDEKAAVDGHEKSCRYKLRPLSDAQVKICSICKRDFQEIFIPLIKTKRDGLIECRLCDPGSRLIKVEDFLPHLDSAHRRGRSSHRQRCAEKSRKCGMCPFLCASYGHYKRHMGEVHRQVLED